MRNDVTKSGFKVVNRIPPGAKRCSSRKPKTDPIAFVNKTPTTQKGSKSK